MQAGSNAISGAGFSGIVKEIISTAGYTYALIDTGKSKVWAVAPGAAVKAGDTVTVSGVMPMENYKSKTLNRTFDFVYFAGSIARNGEQRKRPVSPSPHSTNSSTIVPMAKLDFSKIKKPLHGVTIADMYTQKDALIGKKVVFAARVVKITYAILGKNWLHVQDGTGDAGSNDLTVTTVDNSSPGNTVIVEGTLAKDKKIGNGDTYGVIVENAKLTAEK